MIGRERETEKLLIAFLAGGHVLIEDVPGSGKTKLAKAFARTLGCAFNRVQFTPDLLPSDITGIRYFNMKNSEFEFIPGPAFTNVLLADELNRATPKTQSGLLECMEERQITVDGETHRLPSPFMVIATQNPIENLGVFPLPEAQLDRFLMKIRLTGLNRTERIEVLERFGGEDPLDSLTPACSDADISRAVRECVNVFVHRDMLAYISDIAAATHAKDNVILGVSTRGCISLMKAAKCRAALNGRDYVAPDDVKALAVDVFAHRLIMKGTLTQDSDAPEQTVKSILEDIPVPTEDLDKYKL